MKTLSILSFALLAALLTGCGITAKFLGRMADLIYSSKLRSLKK